mgnify:CR=1 FL=1
MKQHDTVVVTGGSTGIGAAICQHFLEAGLSVVNLSRRPLGWSNPKLHNITVDLSDRLATEEAAKETAKDFVVTGLVHNAGLIRADVIEDVDLHDYDYLSQVHIGAAICLTQSILPTMKARGFGRIILITSRAALGLRTRTSYTATKAGMIGMARTWALELGSYGITVNTVAPGPIADTEMFSAVTGDDQQKLNAIAASIPVKRLGQSTDVADAVAFLAGEGAGFITGQTLMVCGGASLGSLSL